jgi:CsbD-like
MDKDRIKGSGKQAKGAVKEAVGQVTGDAKSKAEGKTESCRQGTERHRRPKGRGARQVGMPDRFDSARAFPWSLC